MAKEKRIVQIEDEDLKNHISDYSKKQKELKDLKKDSDGVSKIIKTIAEKKWLELYNEDGTNPGTIVIEAEDGFGSMASITYVPSNRFTSVSDKNLESIIETIGDEYIEIETEHVIDSNIYEKYSDLINDFIINNENIETKDKIGFIKKVDKFSIDKNIMDNLDGLDNVSVSKVFETIKPVFSIKDPITS